MFWAWAGPASQSLTFIDRALGRSGSPSPHFYRHGLGQRGAHNPWLLSTGIPHFYRQGPASPAPQPLTSIGQTPHFYQPSQPAPIQKIVSPPNQRCNCSAPNSKH